MPLPNADVANCKTTAAYAPISSLWIFTRAGYSIRRIRRYLGNRRTQGTDDPTPRDIHDMPLLPGEEIWHCSGMDVCVGVGVAMNQEGAFAAEAT